MHRTVNATNAKPVGNILPCDQRQTKRTPSIKIFFIPHTNVMDAIISTSDRLAKLPTHIRWHIARYMTAPYLGHRALMKTRENVLASNRWCIMCGETNTIYHHPSYSRYNQGRRQRIMLLCWACDRTVCNQCWDKSRCCKCSDIAETVLKLSES